MYTHETTLRRDASDVEEAALDEESTATRGSLRDSESLEDIDIEDISQSETVGFFEEALKQAHMAEPGRGTRARNIPQFFAEIRTHLAVTEGDYVEPKTDYEAKQGDDWEQWHRATKDEVKARDLEPTETPNRQGRHTGKMGLQSEKLGPTGQVDIFKARYVSKGFKQVEGLDYLETFAHTCKPETFRILLELSAKLGIVMHQFDVKKTLLHSPIEEEVYLEQPQEFVKQGSDEQKLCRLNISIYGLKQAANNWYKELANFLLRLGLTRSRTIACSREQRQGHTFLLVGVDDIIVASRSMTVIFDIKKALEATFHKEDRGRLHWFLGLRTRREESKVTVDQERYIGTMLEWCQMDQCKPSATPADLNLKLQTAQNRDEEVDQRIYGTFFGSLLYRTKQTRPEIMFTVNILSRHMNAPTSQHRMCGKQILRYIQGSKSLNLRTQKKLVKI